MGIGGKPAQRRGFTLVEVMVAVGIIGLLASIALPTYNGYVYRARDSERLQHLARLYQGAAAYYQKEHILTEGTNSGMLVYCVPIGAGHFMANFGPSIFSGVNAKPKMFDFGSHPIFSALNFDVAGPVYAHYLAWPTTPYIAANFCGIHDSGVTPMYQVISISDYDEDGAFGFRGFDIYARDGSMWRGAAQGAHNALY